MRDGDLRRALSATISDRYVGHRYVLVPEVEIFVTMPGRIDALLVSDRIRGFEIKSNVDSLRRLPRQVEVYGPVLERATLVVGTKHAEAAAEIVPAWWAVWVARHSRCGLTLTTRRRGRLNPNVDASAVATFIPKEPIVKRLRSQGATRLSTKPICELRDLLVANNYRADVLDLARSTMLARRDWWRRTGTKTSEAPSSASTRWRQLLGRTCELGGNHREVMAE